MQNKKMQDYIKTTDEKKNTFRISKFVNFVCVQCCGVRDRQSLICLTCHIKCIPGPPRPPQVGPICVTIQSFWRIFVFQLSPIFNKRYLI